MVWRWLFIFPLEENKKHNIVNLIAVVESWAKEFYPFRSSEDTLITSVQ